MPPRLRGLLGFLLVLVALRAVVSEAKRMLRVSDYERRGASWPALPTPAAIIS